MYQKAIVTFIDILGFGDLVKQSESDAVSINEVLDVIQKETSEEDDHTEVISFSDSIVRIRKIETKENKEFPMGLLYQELISLVHAQGKLIDFNLIIRGSVSVGEAIFTPPEAVFLVLG